MGEIYLVGFVIVAAVFGAGFAADYLVGSYIHYAGGGDSAKLDSVFWGYLGHVLINRA
jgi:hypothetical protein